MRYHVDELLRTEVCSKFPNLHAHKHILCCYAVAAMCNNYMHQNESHYISYAALTIITIIMDDEVL